MDEGDHPVELQAGLVRHVGGDAGDHEVIAGSVTPKQQSPAHGIVGAEQQLGQLPREHDGVWRVKDRSRVAGEQGKTEQLEEPGICVQPQLFGYQVAVAQHPERVVRTHRAPHARDSGHQLAAEGSRCPREDVVQSPRIRKIRPRHVDLVDLLAPGVEAVPSQLAVHVQADEDADHESRRQAAHIDGGVHAVAAQIPPGDDEVVPQHSYWLPSCRTLASNRCTTRRS